MSRGFHNRGYLPHWDLETATQALTFRLDDSIPKHVIDGWREDFLEIEDDELREKELHRLISKFEDKGYGSCVLRDPMCAGIIQGKMISGHGAAYKLLDWCVMPNHVHVMIRMLDTTPLFDIVQKWKGGSAVGSIVILVNPGRFGIVNTTTGWFATRMTTTNAVVTLRYENDRCG